MCCSKVSPSRMTGESTAARHETSSMAKRSVVGRGKRIVGGVQEDGASADSRRQASGKHRQGERPGAVGLGSLALKRQGIGAGKVNDPALFRLGRDESNLFAVGRGHCYTSQFHGCSFGRSYIRYVQYRIGLDGVAIDKFVG